MERKTMSLSCAFLFIHIHDTRYVFQKGRGAVSSAGHSTLSKIRSLLKDFLLVLRN